MLEAESWEVLVRMRWLVAGSALLLALGVVMAPAYGAPVDDGSKDDEAPFTTPLPEEMWAQQDKLLQVADPIDQLVDPTEDGQIEAPYDGYLVVAINVKGNYVDLRWKGPLPDDIQRIIDAHPEVKVFVRDAEYSANEFLGAQKRIWDAVAEFAKAHEGVRLLSIQHIGLREGLLVTVSDPDGRLTEADVHSVVAGQTDIPTEVELTRDTGENTALTAADPLSQSCQSLAAL